MGWMAHVSLGEPKPTLRGNERRAFPRPAPTSVANALHNIHTTFARAKGADAAIRTVWVESIL